MCENMFDFSKNYFNGIDLLLFEHGNKSICSGDQSLPCHPLSFSLCQLVFIDRYFETKFLCLGKGDRQLIRRHRFTTTAKLVTDIHTTIKGRFVYIFRARGFGVAGIWP